MVRETLPSDLEALENVIEASGLFPAELLTPMIEPYFVGNEGGTIWLTLITTKPIGLLYCAAEKFAEGAWNTLLIAVHPDFQNAGHGAALVLHLEAELRSRGARLALVETSSLDEYAQARAFYRKLGYHEEARIREFWAPGEDKLIFTKAIG